MAFPQHNLLERVGNEVMNLFLRINTVSKLLANMLINFAIPSHVVCLGGRQLGISEVRGPAHNRDIILRRYSLKLYSSDLETEETLQEFSSICYFQFIYMVITLNSLSTTDLSVFNNIKSFHFQTEASHFLH